MAADNSESFFVKIGILFDKSGARAAALGVVDIKRAAASLYESLRKIVDVNSDLYNTAKYLNIGTDDLQIWERAFRLIGGSADDARSAISNLNFVYDKLRLGMDTGKAEIGARLHLNPSDYLSFDTMMRALNKSYNEYFKGNYGAFKVLAEQLGLSQSAMLLVTQSTSQFESTLARANRIPLISKSQLQAARELDMRIEQLSINWETFKSKLISPMVPGLVKVFDRLEEVFNDPDVQQNIQDFFKVLENGFNDLASDENITKLIENLGKLAQAAVTLGGWIYKGGNATIAGAEGAGGAIGALHGEYERAGWEGVANMFGLDLINTKWNNSTAPTNITQNIQIDGSKDPEAVGQAVVDASKAAINGNVAKRTIDTRRIVTGI